jgi:hypothetical protein
MFKHQIFKKAAKTIGLTLCLACSEQSEGSEPAWPIPIAIADFGYNNIAGEPRDQTPAHQIRLKSFMASIRSDLAANGRYRVVAFSCGEACADASATPAELAQRARSSGARLLLCGGIHKMSALVHWASVQVVDLDAGKIILDRVVTFRPDTDESWRRAEASITKKLQAQGLTQ